MTAEEMFKNLGYKKVDRYGYITYEQENDEYCPVVIEFDDDATFIAYRRYTKEAVYLSCEELKAIVKQYKELGWIDETN